MKRLLKSCARAAIQGAGVVFIGLLHLVRPFRLIKIGYIHADRIGHFTTNTEVFLRRLQLGRLPAAMRLFVAPVACNAQLMTMYKRCLPILESAFLSKAFRICEPRFSKSPFYEPITTKSNEYEEFGGGRASLAFTPAEEERGRAALARLGIGPKDWFVCFHARDSAYLSGSTPGKDWSYHDYRDCDVENFLDAAAYVAGLGGFAVRMGASVSKPLRPGLHPRIIDYAVKHRDEFLDLYLVAKARFFIGSDTGLAQAATAFDVPIVNTNVPRIEWAAFRPQDIFIHKRLVDERLGRPLTFPEILARGHGFLTKTSHLVENKLRLIENSAEDILDATREMQERLSGTFQESAEDRERQRRYRALFVPGTVCHAHQSRIGRDFLRKHADIIFGEVVAKGRAS